MRFTVTLSSPERREQARQTVARAVVGTRVTFEDPAISNPQQVKLKLMIKEIACKVEWHGSKRSEKDWMAMFTAVLAGADVIPGIDEGTVVCVGIDPEQLSRREASSLIELINAFCAERGIELKGD